MENDKIIFFIAVALWIIQFLLFKDQQRKGGHSSKDLSLPLMQAGVLLCIFVSIIFANYYTLHSKSTVIRTLSIFMLTVGIFIRYWTYYITKEFFTRTIHPHKDRPLISYGPYRFARHPFQVGLFLITLGLCLFICAHMVALLIVFPIMGTILHYRMSLEEQLLSQKYGDIYIGWCRRRFRLFPFLY